MFVKGIGKVYVTNRTHCKAESLATAYPQVFSIDYQERYTVLDACDIVISCTNSPHYTITLDKLAKAVTTIKSRTFIDLAVPRDLDTAIKAYPGISFFCLDDLQPALDKNMQDRLQEAIKAGYIIDKYILDFERWYNFRRTAKADSSEGRRGNG
jgi:glutamyl-tRNA reductase